MLCFRKLQNRQMYLLHFRALGHRRERLRYFLVVVVVFFACGIRGVGAETKAPSEAEEIERLPAESDPGSGADREKLFKETEETLREEIARLDQVINTQDPRPREKEDAIVEWFEARLRLADILGMRRGRPLIARVAISVETAEQREELNRRME